MTRAALVQGGLGLFALGVGAGTGSPPLVWLGGILLAWIALEALLVQGARGARAGLAVEPQRVPEDSAVRVRLDVVGAGADDEVRVPLAPVLHLESGTNVWNAASGALGFVLRAPVRGFHAVGPWETRHWSPSRWWAVERSGPLQELEVVPRRDDVRQVGLRNQVIKPIHGRFQANRPGSGFDFFALREYQSGDTMRMVNWKATARHDELIVSQRQLETHSELVLLIDARLVSGTGPAGATPLDRACRVALGLFAEALRARDTIRLAVYGEGVHEFRVRGEDHPMNRLEDFLAHLTPGGDTSLEAAWQVVRVRARSPGPVFVLSSAEADVRLPHALADALGRGHPVTLLSPTPTGPAWERSPRRDQWRRQRLDAARATGAVVVDWEAGRPAHAPKPEPRAVIG